MTRRFAGSLIVALLCCAAVTAAQTGDVQPSLDRPITAARNEGKVVLVGPPDAWVRQELPAAFKARYGIALEYIAGRSTETSAKLRAERSAEIYAEKMLAPLKPHERKR